MEGFAALAGGGADEDDVAAGVACLGLRQHLRGGGLDEAEGAVEVDAEGAAPLLGRHGGDGGFVRGPDAVVDDEAVETAKSGDGSGDEGATVFRGGELLLDGAAVFGAAALGGEGFGLGCGGLVAEDNLCACLMEEADGCSADSTRSSADQSNFSRQRHYDT